LIKDFGIYFMPGKVGPEMVLNYELMPGKIVKK
jgi:hypothetical protein